MAELVRACGGTVYTGRSKRPGASLAGSTPVTPTNYFLSFLPFQVLVCEWQLGHNNFKLHSSLLVLSPSMCSSSNVIGISNHTFNPHFSHSWPLSLIKCGFKVTPLEYCDQSLSFCSLLQALPVQWEVSTSNL